MQKCHPGQVDKSREAGKYDHDIPDNVEIYSEARNTVYSLYYLPMYYPEDLWGGAI